MGRFVIVSVIAVALGCSPAATALSSREPHTTGASLALVWSIEGHATQCTVVRPTVLSDARRSLLSRYRPGAWLAYAVPDAAERPRVMSYASCVVGDETGARTITRLVLSGRLENGDREALAEGLPYDVRWLDEPCEEGACVGRTIALVRPDAVEIVSAEHGGVSAAYPDVRRALAVELGARPEVFEISVSHVPQTQAAILEALERAPRGIAVTQRLLLRDEAMLDADRVGAALASLAPPGPGREIGWRLRVGVFERYAPLPWSLVEVTVADGAIEERARVRRASHDRVVDLSDIDLDEPHAVRRQAGARARAGRVTHDPERRRRLAEERAVLLDRLFELTAEPRSVVEAIEVLLEIGDAGRARELGLEALAVSREDPDVRGAVVRASAGDASLLAGAVATLRPDLPAEAAARLGEGASAALATGVGWPTVEASFDVHRAPRRDASPSSGTSRRVGPNVTADARVRGPQGRGEAATLPIEGLSELGHVLLRASGASGAFSVEVCGPLRANAPRAIDGVGARWPLEGVRACWASVPTRQPSLARLRLLSSALRAQLPSEGEVEVIARAGDASLTLRLAIDGPDARLTGSSSSWSQPAWLAIAREVARPVVSLETTHFPPPTLRLALSEARLAVVGPRLVEERGGALAGGTCAIEGLALACTGRERGPEALLDALVVVTEAALRVR